MEDRNFDDLAEHFEKNIYQKQKGKLRQAIIWRDLNTVIPDLQTSPKLITDIGAGLGQFVTELAKQGHIVTYNDISQAMHDRASVFASALSEDEQSRITWHALPYQDLPIEPANLVLCHAVIEWLVEPDKLLPNLAERLSEGGYLSLCTYNPVGYTMKNLIAGNFKLLDRETIPDFKGSLTPINPQPLEQIQAWLNDAGFTIIKQSGICVFSDYVFVKRGGHDYPDEVFAKEMQFSDQPPFNQIGRYVHFIAKRL